MSNPNGPRDPYGQQGDGSSWTPGEAGGPPYGSGQGSDPSWGQAGGRPGGDMGSGYSAPPPPPGYYGGGSDVPMFSGTEKNNLGVWAVVLGVLGMVGCGLFAAIPAVIVGRRSKEAAAQGLASNGGLGQAGVVLGWIGIVFFVLNLVWLFGLGGYEMIMQDLGGTTGF